MLAICTSEYMMRHLHFWADSINGRLMEKFPLYFLLANENTSNQHNLFYFVLLHFITSQHQYIMTLAAKNPLNIFISYILFF